MWRYCVGVGVVSLKEKCVTFALTVNHPASSAILSFECNMAAVKRGFCSTYNRCRCPLSFTHSAFIVSFVFICHIRNIEAYGKTPIRSLAPPCCAFIPRVGCPDSCRDRVVKSRVSLGEFSVALMYYVLFFVTHIKNIYDFADVSVELVS